MNQRKWTKMLNDMDTDTIVNIYAGKLLDRLTGTRNKLANSLIENVLIHGEMCLAVSIENGEMKLKVVRLRK